MADIAQSIVLDRHGFLIDGTRFPYACTSEIDVTEYEEDTDGPHLALLSVEVLADAVRVGDDLGHTTVTRDPGDGEQAPVAFQYPDSDAYFARAIEIDRGSFRINGEEVPFEVLNEIAITDYASLDGSGFVGVRIAIMAYALTIESLAHRTKLTYEVL